MKLRTLFDLYVAQLRDVHSAEKQLTKALPKMAKAANAHGLRSALLEHLEVTKEQLARVEKILKNNDQTPGRHKCEAMEGLIAEGQEMLEADADEEVLDAGMIVAAQKVEHYEIAAYGSLRTFAEMLGRKDDAALLQRTLEEEKEADESLNRLALGLVNRRAAS